MKMVSAETAEQTIKAVTDHAITVIEDHAKAMERWATLFAMRALGVGLMLGFGFGFFVGYLIS